MKRASTIAAALVALSLSASVPAPAHDCTPSGNLEDLRYSWHVRGGLRWIAGLVFPTSGVGNLRTEYPAGGEGTMQSELLITPAEGKRGGFYEYETKIDAGSRRTLSTYHGYAWGSHSRQERTVFDYVKHVARIRKETPQKIWYQTQPLPQENLRDVLGAIYYLRENAAELKQPLQTSIYSDGREYPVVFRPTGTEEFVIEGQRLRALGFEIVDAPGGKKWPGGVRVWITNDARRLPVRMEIVQSFASLRLDLKSIEACAPMPEK